MEVTRENFKEVLPRVLQEIERCSFCSVDFELTGLHPSFSPLDAISPFDDIEDRYTKLRKSAQSFQPIQFGLSLFVSTGENSYDASVYNFYIFPRPFGGQNGKVFLVEASSVEFLCNAGGGMDFNKVFRQGISYILGREEKFYMERLEKNLERQQRRKQTPRQEVKISDARDTAFVAHSLNIVEEWLKKGPGPTDVLHFDPCNSYLRRLLYQEVEKRFGEALLLQTEKNPLHMTVRVVTAEQRLEQESNTSAQKMDEIREAAGFRRVVDALRESKKLIVGHNMFLDVLHLYHHFVDPLPESCVKFKKGVQEHFPNLLDTKFFANHCPPFEGVFSATNLGDLYQATKEAPFGHVTVELTDERGHYSGAHSELGHEAGFDAYITGSVFLQLSCKYLETRGVRGSDEFPHYHPALQPFSNCFFLMRSKLLFDTKSLENVSPEVENAFIVTDFDASCTTSDVKDFFPAVQRVHWLDETSAIVTVPPAVLDKIEIGANNDRTIKPFSERKCGEKRKREDEDDMDLEEGEIRESKRQKTSESESGFSCAIC
eukprot:TRINITY_DN20678_c0_g1_i1.p1 TRINITY_DN20678_c0_g1~~TRINITY_DN20678_c0_g1_i1.p1  ORF type:complete len:556 (+),score=179.18 TRINITY_DN20678_c0_g1_i1:35-1669(+)